MPKQYRTSYRRLPSYQSMSMSGTLRSIRVRNLFGLFKFRGGRERVSFGVSLLYGYLTYTTLES